MTVELARRLIESGVVAADEVEAALLEVSRTGVPLVRALHERGRALAELVERELSRAKLPALKSVRAAPEIAARLPAGLCERLLAVPVREDRSGAVEVACVDPFDPHVASELGFHLGVTVRRSRAPYADLVAALDGLHAGGTFLEGVARALGQRVATVDPAVQVHTEVHRPSERPSVAGPSEPPIPLVRKTSEPKRPRRGTNPGVGESAIPALRTVAEDEDGEPIMQLYRSKAPPPPAVPQVAITPLAQDTLGLSAALDRLAATRSAEQVVDALVAGLGAIAPRVLILAAKSGRYEGRSAFGLADMQSVRALKIAAGMPSVIETACGAGFYLGPISDSETQAELSRVLGARPDEDVYVVPVDVSGRAALVAVLASFESAFGVTRQADRLTRAAGEALQRIVRDRKRGH